MIKSSDIEPGWGLFWLLALVLAPSVLWAGGGPKTTEPEPKPHFVLSAEGELVSLKATNASLKGIVRAIGRHMNIPVVMKMPDRTVTASFKGLSVVEALKHLDVNAIYFQRTEGEKKRITNIIALRRGKDSSPESQAEVKRQGSRPKPFQFEFDPMKVKGKAKAN